MLEIINTAPRPAYSGVVAPPASNSAARLNNYYLNGIEGTTGITPEAEAIMFYKTSNDANAMTTAKVVAALNSYIESNQDNIDTTHWCKWVIGDNNLPALDLNVEWNGTTWININD